MRFLEQAQTSPLPQSASYNHHRCSIAGVHVELCMAPNTKRMDRSMRAVLEEHGCIEGGQWHQSPLSSKVSRRTSACARQSGNGNGCGVGDGNGSRSLHIFQPLRSFSNPRNVDCEACAKTVGAVVFPKNLATDSASMSEILMAFRMP